MFTLIHKDKNSSARLGRIDTARGSVDTPVFMPVGTHATVKGLMLKDIQEAGAQIILSNAYHVFLRPGIEIIKKAGGLHKFMGRISRYLAIAEAIKFSALPFFAGCVNGESNFNRI